MLSAKNYKAKQTVSRENLQKRLWYEKGGRKMLVKLTPVAKPITLFANKELLHFLLFSKVVLFIINDFYTSKKTQAYQ